MLVITEVLGLNKLIDVQDLKVHFNTKRGFIEDIFSKEQVVVKAVDGVSFSLKEGEILSLAGESGSGKTTVGKAVLNLIKPTGGKILFDNEDISIKSAKELKIFRQNAQMIFQDPYQSLNPKQAVIDIVSEPLLIHNLIHGEKDKKDKVIAALELAGLTPAEKYLYRYPHELSGGERQRAAIAGSIILNPKLIVADEPVSMLDVSIRIGILNLLMALRDKKNISFMFITHDLSLAWLISDRIAIMYLGKIVELGGPELIEGKCLHPYTKALIDVMPAPKAIKNRSKKALKGDTPNPIKIPSGCRFHPRCSIAEDICKVEEPPLIDISRGHQAACHLIET